jgi:hypothetical protein
LEGATVATIDERGQAARLGVVPGDTLIAVAGHEVPIVSSNDTEEVLRRDRLITKWMNEAARPVRLIFQAEAIEVTFQVSGKIGVVYNPETGDITDIRKDGQGEKLGVQVGWIIAGVDSMPFNVDLFKERAATGSPYSITLKRPKQVDNRALMNAQELDFLESLGPEEQGADMDIDQLAMLDPPGFDTLDGAVGCGDPALPSEAADRGLAREDEILGDEVPPRQHERLRAELHQERSQRIRASAELVQARQAWSSMKSDLEAERRHNADAQKKVADLQQRLADLSEECKELSHRAAQSEEDGRILRESAEARDHVLEDEVGRLRSQLVAAEGKTRSEVEAASQKVIELENIVAAQVSESHGLVARAVEAENKAETAEWDLRKLQETRAAEQAELRAENERELYITSAAFCSPREPQFF